MPHHGLKDLTGMHYACRHANPERGRFRRLFPDLPPLYHDPRVLREAGAAGGPMQEGQSPNLGTSSSIPLGYCFLGQFIDHDITLDVSSSFQRVNDPEGIDNVRTPVLDLDCVYGQGPEASRHQYFHSSSSQFSSSIRSDTTFRTRQDRDLPRFEGAALIGDFRNDENRIVSQLQLVFLQLHNTIHRALLNDLSGSYAPRHGYRDHIRAMHDAGDVGGAREEIFEETRKLTRWHYQWVVVQDFLRRIAGDDVVDDILCNGRKVYTCKSDPFIPIEFAVAAYRYGHTQVPNDIIYNGGVTSMLFNDQLGDGFDSPPSAIGDIDWRHFFGPNAQAAGAIDTKLAEAMLNLPFVATGGENSLATRNLLRAQSFRMPSGQAVAAKIASLCDTKVDPAPVRKTGLPKDLHDHTPLWLYILAEGLLTNGERLGPVGGRLIAEVLIGLLECDPTSYLGANRSWIPELMRDPGNRWDMAALVEFARNGTYA